MWVPFTLLKRDRIIAAVNSCVCKYFHTYSIHIPTSVEDVKRIDRKNAKIYWQEAISKEMSNFGIAFKILEDDESVPPGYKKSSGHIIFDVKMDFMRKARWVKDGNRTPDPESSSYAGVLYREIIRIILTHSAMHGVPVTAADMPNA